MAEPRFTVKQYSIVYLDNELNVLGIYPLGGRTSHRERVEFAKAKGLEDFSYYLFVHYDHLLDHYYGFDRYCDNQIDFDLETLKIINTKKVERALL